MKFYISGKIGENAPSKETLAKFKEAEEFLKEKGHEVFNPTTSGLGLHAESLARATTKHRFIRKSCYSTSLSFRNAMP